MKEFNAYIDEAGDEGFQFRQSPSGQGSSHWFVVVGVIVEAEGDRTVASSISRIKTRLWPHQSPAFRKPLHWSSLDHPKKKVVIQELTCEDFKLIAVAVEKSHPRLDADRFDPRKVRARSPRLKSTLYFYASRFLVERICKSVQAQGGRVNLVFENRSSLSVKELETYLSVVSQLPGPYGRPTITLPAIGRISAEGKQQRKLLQVADACAGALFNALEVDRFGNVEDSHVLALANKFDRVDGRLWGYGIKLFPGDKLERVRRSAQYAWMDKI